MKKKYLLVGFKFTIIITFIIQCLFVQAQIDTVFWFAPTYVNPFNGNGPVYLRLINNTNLENTVRVYLPANIKGLDTLISIPKESIVSINLTSKLNILTNKIPGIVKRTGIKIVSRYNICAYYEVIGRSFSDLSRRITNPEIFVLKGKNSLGHTFFIPSQNFWNTDNNPDSDGIDGKTRAGWYGGEARATSEIMATEDNSIINIVPTNPYRDQNDNIISNLSPFNIILNKGEVYTLEAAYWAPDKHLGGTKVTSNKPIAITDKDDTVKEGAGSGFNDYGSDLIGDQLVSVEALGSEYLILAGYLDPTPTGINDFVFIIPSQNDTYLNVDGINFGGPYKSGEVVRVRISKPAVKIFSMDQDNMQTPSNAKPIYMYHVTGIGNELASAVIPPLNSVGSSSIIFNGSDLPADNFGYYANLLVKDGHQDNFILDGKPLKNITFSFATDGWKFGKISNVNLINIGSHKISNTSSTFHMSIIKGDKMVGSSYGYFSDYSKSPSVLTVNKKYDSQQINVFPNPSRNDVTFMLDEDGVYKLNISDLRGQQVINPISFSGKSFQLFLNELSTGMYLYTLENSVGYQTNGKLFVNK